MLEVMLENYVPTNMKDLEKDPSWEYDYKEGEWFKAISISQNKKAICTYILNTNGESTTIQTNDIAYDMLDGEWKTVHEKHKPISQNNGTGVVRLSGGWVVNRFGYFRRKKFQDFLDMFSISSIKNFNEYGFDTTFVIKDTAPMSTRLLIPKRTAVSFINRGKTISTNNIKCKIVCEKYNDILVARVVDGDFWIYEETIRRDGKEFTSRRMYVRGKSTNIMSFHDELVELFK